MNADLAVSKPGFSIFLPASITILRGVGAFLQLIFSRWIKAPLPIFIFKSNTISGLPGNIPLNWYYHVAKIADLIFRLSTEAQRFRLLGQIAASQNLEDCTAPLVEFARLEFSPQSVVVLLFDEGHVPICLLRWIPDDLLRDTFDEDYFNLGYLLDPFALKAATETEMSAYRIFEIAPDRFESNEYYANYYRKTGMVDELGALMRINNEKVIHLSIGRNAGYQKYTTRETRKFKLLYPAIMPKLAALAVTEFANRKSATSPGNLAEIFEDLNSATRKQLSRREAEIAALITQGHSSRSISLNLGISIHTVKVHRRNIYKKLSISAQNELFGLVMTLGGQTG